MDIIQNDNIEEATESGSEDASFLGDKKFCQRNYTSELFVHLEIGMMSPEFPRNFPEFNEKEK
jgi:hypothetical protein